MENILETMKEGYILNKYEIICISKLMGANYLFNIGLNISATSKRIVSEAEKTLINKNYVHNHSNKLILNNELVQCITPFVNPERIISARKKKNNKEQTVLYFIRDKRYVIVEQNTENNYVFIPFKDFKTINDNILKFIFNEEQKLIIDKKARFIITVNEYKILSDLIKRNEIDKLNYFIDDLGIDCRLVEEIKSIFSDNQDFISFCFFYDYKNNPINFNYLLYYFTNEGCWKLNSQKSFGENIEFSSITENTIKKDIAKFLYQS